MRIRYQRERARELWPEILPLLELHWQEIATYADIPLDPDVERYNSMDDAGFLRCYTARGERVEDAGKEIRHIDLIGYSVISVAANLHYRSSKIAMQDVLFVHPDYRRTEAGIGLIRFTEASLCAEGVQVVYQHQKIAHPALGVVLKRQGYEEVERIWAKRLDKGD